VIMAGPSPILYVLKVRKPDGSILTGTPSIRDLEGTKRLAQGVLRLTPAAGYIDIHPFNGGVPSEACETVHREAANEESRT
jgi:hypothetical protein